MARTPSYDSEELERQIGPHGPTPINSANRALVQNWLVAKGFAAVWTKSCRVSTLYKAYNRPAYFAKLAELRDSGELYRGKTIEAESDEESPPMESSPAQQPEPPSFIPPIGNGKGEFILTPPTSSAPKPRATGNGRDTSQAAQQIAELIASLAGKAEIDEGRVVELIREHAPKPEERIVEKIVVLTGEERRELDSEPRHHLFPKILSAIGSGLNVALVGPAGSGKTTLCDQVARALELAFGHHGAFSGSHEMSGYRDAHGNYQRTEFRDRFEHGGLFLADEMDASDPGAVLFANTALANGVCAFPDGNIHRHKEFRFIAACNTFGRGQDRVYVGRNPLDAASLDRFVFFTIDYDSEMERALFGDTDWSQWCHKVRRAVESLKQQVVVSTRAIDYGTRLLKAGIAWPEVEELVLWKGLERDQIAKIRHHADTQK